MITRKGTSLWLWNQTRWEDTLTLDTCNFKSGISSKMYIKILDITRIIVRGSTKRGYFRTSTWHDNWSKEKTKVTEQRRSKKSRYSDIDERVQKADPCSYCGLFGAHVKGGNCPAYGTQCELCRKCNHFSSVCRANTGRQYMQCMHFQGHMTIIKGREKWKLRRYMYFLEVRVQTINF